MSPTEKMGMSVVQTGATKGVLRNARRTYLLRARAQRVTTLADEKKRRCVQALSCLRQLLKKERWCPGPESNRHTFRWGILSPLRLPISPPGHGRKAAGNYGTVPS